MWLVIMNIAPNCVFLHYLAKLSSNLVNWSPEGLIFKQHKPSGLEKMMKKWNSNSWKLKTKLND